MTALSRAALRLARVRIPASPTGTDVPQYLSPADALRPLSDHALWELRDDIDRELHARAFVSLTAVLRFHLAAWGLLSHREGPAVAATFTATRHVDGWGWDPASPTIRYADGAELHVNLTGTTVDDELTELVTGADERPGPGDTLTVPLLTL